MKNPFDPVGGETVQRPGWENWSRQSERHWGKMTAPQMLGNIAR